MSDWRLGPDEANYRRLERSRRLYGERAPAIEYPQGEAP